MFVASLITTFVAKQINNTAALQKCSKGIIPYLLLFPHPGNVTGTGSFSRVCLSTSMAAGSTRLVARHVARQLRRGRSRSVRVRFPPGLLDEASSQGRSRHPCETTISQPGCQNRQRYRERMEGKTNVPHEYRLSGFLCFLSAQEWGRLCSRMPDTSHARWPILSTPWGSRSWVQSGPSSAWFWASYLTTANTP